MATQKDTMAMIMEYLTIKPVLTQKGYLINPRLKSRFLRYEIDRNIYLLCGFLVLAHAHVDLKFVYWLVHQLKLSNGVNCAPIGHSRKSPEA